MLNETVTVEVKSIVTVFCFVIVKKQQLSDWSGKETKHET